jgi:hypothetical protein
MSGVGSPDDAANERSKNRRVEQALAQQMNVAREELRVAILSFRDAVGQLPSGIPRPDSSLYVLDVSKECSRAQKAFDTAQERWFKFLSKGIIPEDLKDL